MSRPALFLLGPPRIERDGEPIEIGRRKAIALIAYLAVTRQVHSRDALATLFWPEYDQSRARAGLRRVLASLKKSLGEGWLDVDRESVGLNREAELWLDVAVFQERLAACGAHDHRAEEVCLDCLPLLVEAAELYRDDFLAGFTLRDSPAFDEWQLFQSQGLRADLAGGLERLARELSQQGEYQPAIVYARRWLALDPLHEPAHRCLMAFYARSDQRAAALRQYQACERVLQEELGVPPQAETTRLYQAIKEHREGTPAEPQSERYRLERKSTHAGPLPAFLEGEVESEEAEAPVFVARQRELAQLDEHLAAVLEGQPAPGQPVGPGGRVMFVTGEAGRGKTALLHEFARRAQATHPELMVASGHCSAYTGVGDPYLPFRDVMGMLSGDVERAWAAGAITREHACRLWSLTPHTAQALADDGPDLIDVFVSGSGLVRRATAGAPGGANWLSRLQDLAERERAGPGDLEQPQLFEQYTQVLRSLAAGNPLLLTLDDLQWADTASTSLLFHLGRRLEGSRILVLGAYRPSDVALGRPTGDMGEERQHPLQPVITELKRIFGDIHLDLGQVPPAEGREFVDAFLDTEPHRLGEEFRQALFRHTGGHPLFTVELLRDMQERGDLIQDEAGRWIVGPALAWEALPARVEAVIEGRIGRLKGELREILTVASVEGEDFTAQVVARVQAIGERRLLRQLSQELEKRHRLVRELGEVTVGCQRLSRYRFGHVLFQQHLYNGLSLGERRLLHGEIAKLLEELYQGCTDQIAVQLARHYVEAGQLENAADYLLRSANQARRLYANDEALRYYQQVEDYLTHLSLEDHWPSALQMHLKRSALHRLNGDYELAEYDLTCALELAQSYQDTRAEAEAYSLLADLRHYEMRNEESLAAARRAHAIATTHHHLPELNTSLVQLGIACDMLGDVERSMVYLGQAQELAEERGDQLTVARVLNTMAVTWWLRQGELDKALDGFLRVHEIRRAAGAKDREAECLANIANVQFWRGEFERALEASEAALRAGHATGWQCGISYVQLDQAEVYCYLGDYQNGARLIEEAQQNLVAGDDLGQAYVQLCLGRNLHFDLGRDELAIPVLRVSTELMREHDNYDELIVGLTGLGGSYLRQHQLSQARACLSEAQELSLTQHFPWRRSETRYRLGLVAFAEDRLDEAADWAQRALEAIAEGSDPQWLGPVHLLLARVARQRNSPVGSIASHYRQAISLAETRCRAVERAWVLREAGRYLAAHADDDDRAQALVRHAEEWLTARGIAG